MRKTWLRSAAIAAVFCLAGTGVLSLTGCGTEEKSSDATPPDHSINLPRSQDKYLYGVTDTIVIRFSEDIDTGGVQVTLSDKAGIAYAFRDASTLLLFGKLNTHGQMHFPLNLSFNVTLEAIRDLQGNASAKVTEFFQPLSWADRDNLDNAFDAFDSLFLPSSDWIDGRPVTDSLVSEGSLDFNRVPGEALDPDDFKLFQLPGGDTLSATLLTRKDVDVQVLVYGPFKSDSALSGLQGEAPMLTVNTGTKGTAKILVGADVLVHKRELGTFDATGLYVLKLKIPDGKEGFYRLGARVHKFR